MWELIPVLKAGVAALERIAKAQERQADSMDALGSPPSLDEQMQALQSIIPQR